MIVPTGTTIYKTQWESRSKGLHQALQYRPGNTKHIQTLYVFPFIQTVNTQKQRLQSKKGSTTAFSQIHYVLLRKQQKSLVD